MSASGKNYPPLEVVEEIFRDLGFYEAYRDAAKRHAKTMPKLDAKWRAVGEVAVLLENVGLGSIHEQEMKRMYKLPEERMHFLAQQLGLPTTKEGAEAMGIDRHGSTIRDKNTAGSAGSKTVLTRNDRQPSQNPRGFAGHPASFAKKLQPGATPTELMEAAVVSKKTWKGRPRAGSREVVEWVMNHLDCYDIEPADAPSPGAWALLMRVRLIPGLAVEFITKVWAKTIPPRSKIEAEDQDDPGDQRALDIIDRVRMAAQEAEELVN